MKQPSNITKITKNMFENQLAKSVNNKSMISVTAFHQIVKFVHFISQNKIIRMDIRKKLHHEYRAIIISVATLR